MSDYISRQAAIDALCKRCDLVADEPCTEKCNDIKILEMLPSAQPERTEHFSDTKAIPSQSDCVCLSEKVTATFFDAEYEEWTQKTVTIADVLDSVCDDYTVLPSAQPDIMYYPQVDGVTASIIAQPEIIRCKGCKYSSPNKVYGCRIYSFADDLDERMYADDFCSRAERRTDEQIW